MNRAVAAILVLGLALGAPAQEGGPPDRQKEVERLSREALEAYQRGDDESAERALRAQIALDPGDFVPYYNLACARARRGDPAEGLAFLTRSIEKGFVDRVQMEKDPALAPVRALPEFRAIAEGWPRILEAHRDANVALARTLFKDATRSSLDGKLRLAYLSAFDEASFEDATGELSRLASWADASVFPGILDPKASGGDAWVVVVLPSRADFARWATSMFGPGALEGLATIGGLYSHDTKRLVAQDLGATLRHEFFHVLHWRSMTRLGQRHPIWIMEGLCSLAEDYDLAGESLVPAPSWRTNTVKRMERAHLLLPIRELASRTHAQFQGPRRMGLYAQARGVFLYLGQKGKLKEWYARYTRDFADDPTGVRSLGETLAMTPEEFDQDFKAWARALPDVPERLTTGMASLGVEVDAGAGEGPIVVSLPRARSPLATGDVITALNGGPTRDLPELLRRLGGFKPGDTVTVAVRRGRTHVTFPLVLGEYRER